MPKKPGPALVALSHSTRPSSPGPSAYAVPSGMVPVIRSWMRRTASTAARASAAWPKAAALWSRAADFWWDAAQMAASAVRASKSALGECARCFQRETRRALSSTSSGVRQQRKHAGSIDSP